MGEAAGLAAAIAIDRRPGRSRPSDQDANIEESIHWTAIEATQAADRS